MNWETVKAPLLTGINQPYLQMIRVYVSGINAKEEGKHYIYNKLLPHPSPNSASPKMSFLSMTLLVGILKWPVEEF